MANVKLTTRDYIATLTPSISAKDYVSLIYNATYSLRPNMVTLWAGFEAGGVAILIGNTQGM